MLDDNYIPSDEMITMPVQAGFVYPTLAPVDVVLDEIESFNNEGFTVVGRMYAPYGSALLWDHSGKPVPPVETGNTNPPGNTTYTLTYDSAGGSSVASQTYPSGTTVQLTATSTKQGYVLSGWALNSAPTVVVPQVIMNANTTVVAVWQTAVVAPTTYTLTYNVDGGTPIVPPQTGITSGTVVQLTATVTKAGYNFKGWALSTAPTTVLTPQQVTITADTTIIAVWEGALTLTYDATGGTPVPAALTGQTPGTVVTLAPAVGATGAPTKSGSTFRGWSQNGTDLATSVTFATANITVTALWATP
jgi:hypothetical protein